MYFYPFELFSVETMIACFGLFVLFFLVFVPSKKPCSLFKPSDVVFRLLIYIFYFSRLVSCCLKWILHRRITTCSPGVRMPLVHPSLLMTSVYKCSWNISRNWPCPTLLKHSSRISPVSFTKNFPGRIPWGEFPYRGLSGQTSRTIPGEHILGVPW